MRLIHPENEAEWWAARAGRITASRFAMARATLTRGPNKGDWTKAAHDYAFRLAVERISGQPLRDDGFEPYEARRGRELEAEAREYHSIVTGMDIQPGGVAVSDCGRFAASADGLVPDGPGCEYKCFLAPEKLRSILLADSLDDEVIDQIQGGMWITGRDEWHFALYCPALEAIGRDLTIIPVPRDEERIAALADDLERFDELVDHYRTELEKEAA